MENYIVEWYYIFCTKIYGEHVDTATFSLASVLMQSYPLSTMVVIRIIRGNPLFPSYFLVLLFTLLSIYLCIYQTMCSTFFWLKKLLKDGEDTEFTDSVPLFFKNVVHKDIIWWMELFLLYKKIFYLPKSYYWSRCLANHLWLEFLWILCINFVLILFNSFIQLRHLLYLYTHATCMIKSLNIL